MTDWKLIRRLMNTALDACEAIDGIEDLELKRGAELSVHGNAVSVFDIPQSAMNYPENVRYAVIRGRHQCDNDKAFTPETAKILREVSLLCGELINCRCIDEPCTKVDPHTQGGKQSIANMLSELELWYRDYCIDSLHSL